MLRPIRGAAPINNITSRKEKPNAMPHTINANDIDDLIFAGEEPAVSDR